jgi:hypothetical protein
LRDFRSFEAYLFKDDLETEQEGIIEKDKSKDDIKSP